MQRYNIIRNYEKIGEMAPTEASTRTEDDIDVFVHLAHGFGRTSWRDRWNAGKIIGINHEDPYGYRQAETMGCKISQSEDRPESALGRLVRLGVRFCLGFDLLHAWRNRHGIFRAQVIWTHTESQALAILLLLRYRGLKSRPKLIAQTIWTMDDWPSYSFIRRSFYKSLLQQADLLTVHSTSALRRLREIFPLSRTEFVRYGIRADATLERSFRPMHGPIRVLTLGNDRHRDWPTFVAAVRNSPGMEARMVTRTDVSRLSQGIQNLTLATPASNSDLIALYEWADVVVVCLTDNLHASGLTVIQEAVLLGIPVICSDSGDLKSYFNEGEVSYVIPQDPRALASAILQVASDPEGSQKKSAQALARMKAGEINSRDFVAHHVRMSRELLGLSSTVRKIVP